MSRLKPRPTKQKIKRNSKKKTAGSAGRSESRPYKGKEKNAAKMPALPTAQLSFGGVDGFAFDCVRIIFRDAIVVEDHGGAFFGGEFGPRGQACVIGVAFAGEVDPGGGDFLGEGLGFGAVAGHVFGAGLVVKAEGNFGAVERAGARVENRRLPLEPIQVCGSATLRGFAFALRDGALADGRGHHAGINVERFFAGMLIVENFQNLRAVLRAEESCGALGDFFLGHRFVFGMIDAVDEFVEDGADHDGNVGGNCGCGGIVGMHRENSAIDDGRETKLLGHAADIRRPAGAIFGDDGHADVDELTIGNCLQIIRVYIEVGQDLGG